MQTKEILKKLIQIDSQCTKSNLKIVQFIASLFPSENVEIFSLRKGNLNLYNLVIKFNGQNKTKSPIIFSGHTDTVPVSNNWAVNPFEAIEQKNKIIGLGSSDMKAGLACMIKTALSIKENPNQDVYFMFDADEEDGCAGGKDFIKKYDFKNAQVVICEPTDNKLEIGQKGGLEIKATYFGKALHSSRTSFSLNSQFNAIHKAFQAFKKLEKVEKKLSQVKDDLFTSPTQSICLITGGTAGNVIPDQCSFIINRRLLPSENFNQETQKIIKLLQSVDSKVETTINFIGKSNLLSTKSPLFIKAQKISKTIFKSAETSVTSGWTQAGRFNKWGDCLIIGPGNLEQGHKADEFCETKNLDKMVQFYRSLID